MEPMETAIRRYKRAHNLTYRQVSELLGLKLTYTKQLGCGSVERVSPQLARQIEERSGGEISAEEMVFPERFRNGAARRRRGAVA